MSYILDALRRSQAERERGQVPGLDARPAAVAALPEAASGPRWQGIAAAAVLLVATAMALGWWLRSAPPALPAGAALPPSPPVSPSASLPAPTAVPETGAVPGPPTLPIVVSAPGPPPVVVAAAPRAAPASAAAAPPATASAAAPASTLLSALSPAQRRELPPLVMGGSIWSDSALSRFVIVNGQVVREGETAAPGVVVERIGPKAVWLRWRELRLEVPL